MVPPDSDRAPPTPPYSGSRPGWRTFRVRGCHPLRRAFPGAFRYVRFFLRRRPCNPARASTPAVWAGPLSLAATRGVTLVFLSSDYWDVSVRRVRLTHKGDAAPPRGGLPHSDTCGSKAARASPQTFAACRVLPRLREPRHPPCALARFSLSLAARRSRAARQSSRLLFVSAFLPILSKNRAGRSPAQVENVGLEPTTPGLQSRCSSRLSQSPASNA